MRRHIKIAVLCGFAMTAILCVLSNLFVRFFPYRDLPMMPKPFFLYSLSPGIILAAGIPHGWVHECVFYVGNVIAYSIVFLCGLLLLTRRLRFR